MVCIQTFVVVDLETTCLVGPESLPRITEIALYATTRHNLLNAVDQQTLVPRISHQMVFCLDPQQELHPKAQELTGLAYEDLQHERPFDADLVMSIKLFLERMPKPICLVAHHGFKFDFPILQAELNNICEALPEDLYCVDSRIAFQYMFPRGSTYGETTHFKNGFQQNTFHRLDNHKLATLYSFLVDSDNHQDAHFAQADVETLMKCMVMESRNFIDHADNYATLFCNTDPAW